jgi:hypothetical protein
MRGSAAFRAAVAPGGALAGPWVKNELWRRARAVPSLDLRFAENKSLVDATTGSQLVTFTRASSGTFVGSDGVIKTAVTNLLLRSEEFDNASWTKTRSSITANAEIAPNGTTTADKLVEDSSASASHPLISTSVSFTAGATLSLSVYVKASERTSVVLRINNGSDSVWCAFNLATGTVGTVANSGTGSGAAGSIQNVGNGFYRCTLTGVCSSTASTGICVIYPAVSSTDPSNTSIVYTGDGTSGLFIWGAQLEQSSTVGEYIPTTSTINSAPRFDHNPTTGESLGLLVEEQRTNLVLRSEEFDNASWNKALTTVSPNAISAPNGTTTADKLEETSGTGEHLIWQARTGSSETLTLSVFCKQAERTRVRLGLSNFATEATGAIYDLVSGSVVSVTASGTDYTNPSASISAFGNGWFRCVFTVTKGTVNTTNNPFVETVTGSSFSFAGTAGSGLFLWGAQLEQSSTVGEYIPTTSAINSAPRFDHNPTTGESLGLLVEEQRTNLVLRSEEFDNASWSTAGITRTANTSTAPNGAVTADTITENSATDPHLLFQAATASGTCTFSIYVKQGSGSRFFTIGFNRAATHFVSATFDLALGTNTQTLVLGYSGQSASITAVGDGYYRCSVTAVSDTVSDARIGLASTSTHTSTSRGFQSYTGDGTSSFIVWGAQLEAGAFPTSYIRTTTATVTRSADVASISGSNFSSWYRQDEGTVFYDGQVLGSDPSTNKNILGLSNGSNNNTIDMFIPSALNQRFRMVTGGVNQALQNLVDAASVYSPVKCTYAFKVDDTTSASGGTVLSTDTSCSVPTVDRFTLGSLTTGEAQLAARYKRVTFWPTRLSNSTLQAVTQ